MNILAVSQDDRVVYGVRHGKTGQTTFYLLPFLLVTGSEASLRSRNREWTPINANKTAGTNSRLLAFIRGSQYDAQMPGEPNQIG